MDRAPFGQEMFPEVEGHRIDLAAPLLVLKARRGILACGYLSLETMNKLGEAGAVVTGVKSYRDMLVARVIAVSDAAQMLGVSVGQTGRDALSLLDGR